MTPRVLAWSCASWVVGGAFAQIADPAWTSGLEAHWATIEATFQDSASSPLSPELRASFNGLDRFEPDPGYRVMARFKARQGKDFGMPTTTDRLPVYRAVGTLHFTLGGKNLRLTVYQNRELVLRASYENHLFLPFTDLTNGEETYGGGRYLDLEGPLGRAVQLDFNRAYNPYCAYGGRYSCPIPPKENHLPVRIAAGVKAPRH